MSKKFLIQVTTNWYGMDQTYAAIAEDESDLEKLAEELAFNNFSDFDCMSDILEELFPNVEYGEYSDDQRDEAAGIEGEYYGYTIEEYEDPEEEWEWYEIVYDCTKDKN